MTTFRSTVTMFLDDLIYAQHRANKLSERLSRQYREDTTLRFFPVPNALLDEVDITLRFSVDPLDTAGAPTLPATAEYARLPPSRIVAADIAHEIATLVLAELRRRLTPDDQAEGQTIAADLRRQLWTPGVRRDLARNLTAFLHPVLSRHALDPAGPDHDDEARLALRDALDATFGQDADLAAAIGPTRDWVRQLAEGDIGRHATTALKAAATSAADVEPDEPSASAQIRLATHLDDIPEHHVQTARLHAKLRNYTWVIVEEGDREHDQLVPES